VNNADALNNIDIKTDTILYLGKYSIPKKIQLTDISLPLQHKLTLNVFESYENQKLSKCHEIWRDVTVGY
jgi:hypothetical protein